MSTLVGLWLVDRGLIELDAPVARYKCSHDGDGLDPFVPVRVVRGQILSSITAEAKVAESSPHPTRFARHLLPRGRRSFWRRRDV
jgi:hypothetical protein